MWAKRSQLHRTLRRVRGSLVSPCVAHDASMKLILVEGHLSPWGYTMPGVGEPYHNLETGGYWGVADLFRHLGFSDKCVEEGGLWRAAVISHYQPRISEQIAPIPLQIYVGPDGYVRRVSFWKKVIYGKLHQSIFRHQAHSFMSARHLSSHGTL